MHFLFRSIILNEKRLHFVLIGIAVALGALHAWAGRFAMNPDGMSYLDIADAYFAGQWQMALNAFWSPLYSWLLGFGLFLLRPPPAWESTSVHAINFFIYCFALFSFVFFLRSLSRSLPEERVFPRLLWFSFGYALFLIITLHFISLALVTPDMLVAAWVFFAAGIMARVQQGERAPRLFFFLACRLGWAI